MSWFCLAAIFCASGVAACHVDGSGGSGGAGGAAAGAGDEGAAGSPMQAAGGVDGSAGSVSDSAGASDGTAGTTVGAGAADGSAGEPDSSPGTGGADERAGAPAESEGGARTGGSGGTAAAGNGGQANDGNETAGVPEMGSGGSGTQRCAANDPTLDDRNPCTLDACTEESGVSHTSVPDGTPCDDGDACTRIDTCAAGVCAGTQRVVCSAADACHDAGSCDPASGGCSSPLTATCADLPPDPASVAPALDRSVATNVYDALGFLFSGTSPIQRDVAAGAIDPIRTSAVRGRVLTADGAPLGGVTVGFHDHPELGWTKTRLDGRFDLVANGGGTLTLDFARSGFLAAQRAVALPWQTFVVAPDVVLVAESSAATLVDLTSGGVTPVAHSSVTNDDRGTRQAVVMFPPGTSAKLQMPDGTETPLDKLHVHLTEYTVGAAGPAAMPAALPPTSAYTFAFEVTVDEVEAAGATTVKLDPPVPSYVENFLGLPVGSSVPFGYYDKAKAQWVPEPDGRVIQVLGVTDGLADVALVAENQVASANDLAAEGYTDEERRQLAEAYDPGTTLWRVRMPHFSSCDWNFMWGAGINSIWPQNPRAPENTWGCPDQKLHGSIIECPGQVLGETVPVVGTGMALNYRSDWTRGFVASRKLHLQLTDNRPLPPAMKRVDVVLNVAGKQDGYSFAASQNLATDIVWDGTDAYGRMLEGQPPASIRIGYAYPPVVYSAFIAVGSSNASFGSPGGSIATGVMDDVNGPVEAELWQTYDLAGVGVGKLSVRDARAQGLGGWMLDIHHVYDPVGKVLLLGDGTRVDASSLHALINTVAGGQSGFTEGADATAVGITATNVLADPDGGYYVGTTNRVYRVSPTGHITTFAGGGTDPTALGDGGPATSAYLHFPEGLARAPDGSIFIADSANVRIRRVGKDGIITTVAGTGTDGYNGDNIPAVDAELNGPSDVAVGPDGSLYIADTSNNRVRRVDTNGIITTLIGTSETDWNKVGTEDNVPAAGASVFYPTVVKADALGNVYFFDEHYPYQGYDDRLRKIDPSGIVSTVAGAFFDWRGSEKLGGPATESMLASPTSMALGPGGDIYVGGYFGSWMIQRITPDGRIWAFAGGQPDGFNLGGWCGDGGLAMSPAMCFANVAGLDVAADGSLLVADGNYYDGNRQATNYRVRRIAAPLPGFSTSEYVLASPDGSEMYAFDGKGRHLRTVNSLTGSIRYAFSYDAAGRLAAVTDGDGNVTSVERASDGTASAIIAPHGQRTELSVGSDGYLASITSPAGARARMSYANDGLLRDFVDSRSGVHHYTFDADGRLLSAADPAGGTQAMTRQDLHAADQSAHVTGYEVDRTTAEGRLTSYHVDEAEGSDSRTAVTHPDGTVDVSIKSVDESRTLQDPDGTLVSVTVAAHSRFGAQTLIPKLTTVKTPSGLQSSTSVSQSSVLDASKNLVSDSTTTTINGHTYSSIFTAENSQVTTTTPAGRQLVARLDSQQRLASLQLPGLAPIAYAYDAQGNLVSAVQSSGSGTRGTSLTYDAAGMLEALTDPVGRQFSFARDADGHVVKEVLPDEGQVLMSYDLGGNLESVQPPGKAAHDFAYTPVDLVSSYTPPATADVTAPSTTYAYDRDRSLLSTTRPDSATLIADYDAGGRISAEHLPAVNGLPAETITLGYSATSGQLTTLAHSAGIGVNLSFDGFLPTGEAVSGLRADPVPLGRVFDTDFRLSAESIDGGAPVNFGYDADGLLTQAGDMVLTRNPQSGLITGATLGLVNDTWTYDAFGEPSAYSAQVATSEVLRDELTRDKLGRITSKVETIQGAATTWAYDYDAAGRLTDVSKDGSFWSHYDFDANGNRTAASVSWPSATNVACTSDAQDRLLTCGAAAFTYSANGELRSKTESAQSTTYAYDAAGNLRRVALPDGRTLEYLVDGFGRRVGKKIDGTLTQAFVYRSQLAVAAELDGTGTVVARFVYGSKVNVPEYMVKGANTYRIITDQLGSPRLVIDTVTGEVAQRMDFDEWGNVVLDTNPGFQPFGFAGGLYDRDTGLVRFGARDYDTRVGRWTAKDPIGFAAGRGNLFEYGASNPTSRVDPTGLSDSAYEISISNSTARGSVGPILDWGPGPVGTMAKDMPRPEPQFIRPPMPSLGVDLDGLRRDAIYASMDQLGGVDDSKNLNDALVGALGAAATAMEAWATYRIAEAETRPHLKPRRPREDCVGSCCQ